MKKLYGSAALLLAALVWGLGFVAQSVGLEVIGPYTFQSVRCIIACAFLLPMIAVMDGIKKARGTYHKPTQEEVRYLWRGGFFCGVALTVAACLQQIGLLYTTPAKGGFLTSMYLVMVPILGLLLGKKAPRKIWFCVFLAVVGVYLLSITSGFSLAPGDGFEIACAICFAFHIMIIDHFAPSTDGVKLSCIQFFVSSILSGVVMVALERPTKEAIMVAMGALLYAGMVSSGVGYTLQIIGQQFAEPVTATLLMSLESVFSLLGGLVILGQMPTARELSGCALILVAVVLVQLPERSVLKEAKHEQ